MTFLMQNDISLVQALAKTRILLTKMSNEAADFHRSNAKCHDSPDIGDIYLSKRPRFAENHTLTTFSTNYRHQIILMHESPKNWSRFFVKDDLLFRRGFNHASLTCLAGEEAARVLKSPFVRMWRASRGLEITPADHIFLLLLVYFRGWCSILRSKMSACQLYGNLIYAPAIESYSLSTLS